MSTKSVVKSTSDSKDNHVMNALKEVKMIRAGKLPEKTARDFLKESRNR